MSLRAPLLQPIVSQHTNDFFFFFLPPHKQFFFHCAVGYKEEEEDDDDEENNTNSFCDGLTFVSYVQPQKVHREIHTPEDLTVRNTHTEHNTTQPYAEAGIHTNLYLFSPSPFTHRSSLRQSRKMFRASMLAQSLSTMTVKSGLKALILHTSS